MTAESNGALPDLAQCANEPIHIAGAIQPQGVLLSLDLASLATRQVSDNAQEVLGIPVERLLDAPAGERLGEDQAALLRIAMAGPNPEEADPLAIAPRRHRSATKTR
jgi:chemotaxis family two-component system sensor kinase Cph1